MTKYLALLLLFISTRGAAQTAPYNNNIYNPAIKTVEFYNTKKDPSFPIINLNSAEQVQLAFDDLRGGVRNYYYSIEHCDGDWNSSNLSPTQYLQNFTEDKIIDYTYSSATFQKYTHYTVKFPNEYIKPKISGNYILRVYQDDDPTKLILTRRFYVLNSKVTVSGEVVASSEMYNRAHNQKINFQIDYGTLKVQNPNTDIRTWVMQNQRDETGSFTTQPQYIRG
ncbi:MAG: type IX secretion system plug protein domain-containing protein, partial [Sphingobacteriales bacterium]